MARIYSNENFPLPTVNELRRLGHDCETVAESGSANIQMTDPEVLTYAMANGRAVLTLNRRHFIALHQQVPNHSGIIVCIFDPNFIGLAQHVHEAITPFEKLEGQLIRVRRST